MRNWLYDIQFPAYLLPVAIFNVSLCTITVCTYTVKLCFESFWMLGSISLAHLTSQSIFTNLKRKLGQQGSDTIQEVLQQFHLLAGWKQQSKKLQTLEP